MPLQATSGAASYDGFGGGVAAVPQYIEDVFSTYLYKGNSLTQTITNNIDLSTKGGLVWIKSRDTTFDHMLLDTARGASKYLNSNATTAESTNIYQLSSFNTNGFTLGDGNFTNNSAYTYASWTFRKQPKFFDIVTYTGTGGSPITIAHNLGSVPGCIIVKRTDTTANWPVYHRSLTSSRYSLLLNLTGAEDLTDYFSTTAPTSTNFTVGTNSVVNASGGTYVAYLFAHDAGGFGLSGTDNVITCGGFTTDGAGAATVNLGYEPQWLLVKRTSGAEDWNIGDNMRGMPNGDTAQASGLRWLKANNSDAEQGQSTNNWYPTATGFKVTDIGYNNSTFIYIAIRRGPMKVPTNGTSVFTPAARSGTGAVANVTGVGFPPDLYFSQPRQSNSNPVLTDRLRGATKSLSSRGTFAEQTETGSVTAFGQDGVTLGANDTDFFGGVNQSGFTYANWNFSRAPSFFDEVCYTGTGSATTQTHNLGVVPELIIVKRRSAANAWAVYANNDNTDYLVLNTTAATADDVTYWNDTSPTSSVFSVGTNNAVNASASTYVAYLFATCAGVSKVGSYTGTGTTQTINCGFTAGSRFVLIKRTDSTGDWYVWDSARGIIAGNDPYLLLNSSAAEVTGTDYIDTASTGFEISSTAPAAINASAGTFVFLAIA